MKDYTEPRMHTAEHILNQTMVRMFDCGRAFSAHIEKKKSKCDYHFNRELAEAEISEIQVKVNAIIQADLPVTEEFVSREAAQTEFSLERLPEKAGDNIRIVRVGDYDACPCIGPHAGSSKEVGEFRITTASYRDGVLRVRYKLTAPE